MGNNNLISETGEDGNIKKTIVPITILLLLAVSFLLITAVCCDFFQVYLPGIAAFIPEQFRKPAAAEIDRQDPGTAPGEEVVVVEKGSLNKDKK